MHPGLTARPPFPWVGGKERLQYIIRSVFPEKTDCHAEHFGGSGSILLGLPARPGRVEVYNDRDSDLANLMLCIRDRVIALLDELKFFPLHSEEEFNLLVKILNHEMIPPDFTESELEIARIALTEEQYRVVEKILRGRAELWDVRRAAAFYTVDRRSFNSMRTTFAMRPTRIKGFLKQIAIASQRLEGVIITNRDFEESIRCHDGPATLHYCDPPYFDAEHMYTQPFTLRDHYRLHEVLAKCEGPRVVSYNNCPFVRELYEDNYILYFERQNSMSQKEGAKYEELLITNYDPRPILARREEQINMFEPEAEKGKLVLVHEPHNPVTVTVPSGWGK